MTSFHQAILLGVWLQAWAELYLVSAQPGTLPHNAGAFNCKAQEHSKLPTSTGVDGFARVGLAYHLLIIS